MHGKMAWLAAYGLSASEQTGARARTSMRVFHPCLTEEKERREGCGEGLVDLIDTLSKQGIHFKSLTDSINTTTASDRFFFHVKTSLAEMERELIVERTLAGLEVARRFDRTGGRKHHMTDSKTESAKKLLANGVPPRDTAENLGVSVPRLYRWLPA